MKKIMYYIFIFIFCLSLSCEKEIQPTIEKKALFGEWVNLENNMDTLSIDDEVIKRIDLTQGKYLHFYNFKVEGSDIILNYLGLDEILAVPFKSKVIFSQPTTSIIFEGLSNYHPNYEGDTFRKIP